MKPLSDMALSNQTGRTLIELMVALAISTMIILGITALYSSSSQSTRSATQLGAMSEDGALALHLMGQAIKRTAYGEIVGTEFVANDQTLFAFPTLRACKSGRFVNPGTNNFACSFVPGAPDSLMVQFQGEAVAAAPQTTTRNCVGGAPVLTQITDRDHPAYLQDVPLTTNVYEIDAGSLRCAGNGSAFQTMASNIEEFKVYFGYDENAANAALAAKSTMAPSAAIILEAVV
jgi:Tfp pilus assembly protein PilW